MPTPARPGVLQPLRSPVYKEEHGRMEFRDLEQLKHNAAETLDLGDTIRVKDRDALATRFVEPLVRTAIFADEAALRDAARYLIQEIGACLGVQSASIQPLYDARGRGEVQGFTVPAMNIRGLTYDVARAAFRAAQAHRVGALVFEIARSEIDYTEQRPAEYAAAVTAAAIREGFRGPLFLQGDHFQINAAKYARSGDVEVQAVKDLIQEAVTARFLNIDIDTSTLVDLSQPTLKQQQEVNYTLAAELTAVVRKYQPAGTCISVGGEIGEVGKKNSTVEELEAYMDGFLAELRKHGDLQGPSKISVQTGTSHGGVPLPDGSVAEVNVDFDVLHQLSRVASERYGMAGAVQHGASTLPQDAFDHFPRVETAEIHLATGFQNITYDHPEFPEDLRQEVRDHCFDNLSGERSEGWTDEQFLYKTRKKAFGPLKRKMWDLPPSTRDAIGATLEEQFAVLFRKLAVVDSAAMVQRLVKPQKPPSARPAGL
jgi:fructose/tagatose bisphosphate aldolase